MHTLPLFLVVFLSLSFVYLAQVAPDVVSQAPVDVVPAAAVPVLAPFIEPSVEDVLPSSFHFLSGEEKNEKLGVGIGGLDPNTEGNEYDERRDHYFKMVHAAKGAGSFPEFNIWDKDGLLNPPSVYQRYRGNEYPFNQNVKPFFQWWYFYLSDFTNNRYLLLTYTLLKTPNNDSLNLFIMTAGFVDATTGKTWQKEEIWPLSCLKISNNFDLLVKYDNVVMYSLTAVNDGTYKLYGNLNHAGANVVNTSIPKETVITFDLTITRITGWYAQQDVEFFMRIFTGGAINWNTYAQNSIVQGTVSVGGVTTTYINSTQYRAYGDMNWGNKFPSGENIADAMKYPWGWYTVKVPHADPTKDIAIVVGVGAVGDKYLGRNWAAFGDFQLNGTHLGVRKITIWDDKLTLMNTCNQGDLLSFTATPFNFQNFTTPDGSNFSVPLKQIVAIETTNYSILLDYTATMDKINRLVFMSGEFWFSDFEALGCEVKVMIDTVDQHGNRVNLYNFVSQSGGLEYGYQTTH